VPVDDGLDVEIPVVPPVEVLLAFDEPLLPVVAVPLAAELEAPELPPTASTLTLPELPVWHIAALVPRLIDMAMQVPVLPDVARTAALPPSPVDEDETGFEVAGPVLPVLPELASDEEMASPEMATPVLVGLDVVVPVPPVLPVSPEMATP